MSDSNIFEAAMALSESERIRLVERLLETLGPKKDRLEKASFVAELSHRSAEIDQGKTESVSWSDLKNEHF